MTNKIKKFAALGVLLIFVLSMVPIAFAEAGNEGERLRVQEEVMEEVENSGNDQEIREKVQERENVREKIQETKENIQEIKERVKERQENLVEKIKQEKEKLEKLKDDAKKCAETNECKEKKNTLKKGVQEHLVNTIDNIDKSLVKINDKITSSKVLSDQEKQNLTAQLEQYTLDLAPIKEKANALNENSTNQEYKDVIKELKNKWKEVKKLEQKAIAILMSSKMENVVEKVTEDYNEKLQAKVDELKNAGLDTSSLETLKVTYEQKASELKALQDEAKSKLLAGDVAGYKEVQQKVKESFGAVKDALREFMSQYRELKQSGIKTEQEVEEVVNETSQPVTEVNESEDTTEQTETETNETATI